MSKVLVAGRGGGGKSSITALLAWRLSEHEKVLVLDADESNLGLHRMLGATEPASSLAQHLGGKPAVREQLVAAFREGFEKRPRFFEGRIDIDHAVASLVERCNGISLLRVGKIEHAMEGCACPLGVAAKDFLAALDVHDGEWVLVDTEAGLEHFGRGIVEAVDVVLAVVEPSHDAVMLAERAAALSREASRPCLAILNKTDPETEQALREQMIERGLQPAVAVPFSPELARANLAGDPVAGSVPPAILDSLIEMLRSVARTSALPEMNADGTTKGA